MKVIANNTINYKLLCLIPLGISIATAVLFFVVPDGGSFYVLGISIISFIAFIYVLFKFENTSILSYDETKEEVILRKGSENIIVPLDKILTFRKDMDYHNKSPDVFGNNYSAYSVVYKLNDSVEEKSFAIWDDQNELQENFNQLRARAIIARKKHAKPKK